MELSLSGGGYRVLTAPTGEEALAVLARGEHVDLIITDMVLPGINGRALAEAAQAMIGRVKLLFISGYSDDVVFEDGAGEHWSFLQKPFVPDRLRARVRELLVVT